MNQKTNQHGSIIKVGMIVRLRGEVSQHHRCPKGRENNRTAEVLSIGTEGEVFLNHDLRGTRHWNIDDLRGIAMKRPAATPAAAAKRSDAERLMRWVNHDNSCSVRPGDWDSTKCTCGLNKALKEMGLS